MPPSLPTQRRYAKATGMKNAELSSVCLNSGLAGSGDESKILSPPTRKD
jgi:hypothetical protein